MSIDIHKILESGAGAAASAPCRADMGGTLDIKSLYYPLAYLEPCTVNIALDLRTRACIRANRRGYVKVSSAGYETAEHQMGELPFDHPLGLIFAAAAYFHIDGVHIEIKSGSPPQSALGGSSAAVVALIGAYLKLLEKSGRSDCRFDSIPLLAHGIEEGAAKVPCGLQDQLAAFYGGVNSWTWLGEGGGRLYSRQELLAPEDHSKLDKSFLLAYCGRPHSSADINSRWVDGFLAGKTGKEWPEIAGCSREFASALASLDFDLAAYWMNRETDLRCRLTPDVLDETGRILVSAAREAGCGARFCGAGGGGCLWAIGRQENISKARQEWENILSGVPSGRLLDASPDPYGLKTY